jgi:hypothetical protein
MTDETSWLVVDVLLVYKTQRWGWGTFGLQNHFIQSFPTVATAHRYLDMKLSYIKLDVKIFFIIFVAINILDMKLFRA